MRILPILSTKCELKVLAAENTVVHDSIDCITKPDTAPALGWPEIWNAGLPVYHIGNHAGFHGYISQLAVDRPGVVVLHDRALHGLLMPELHKCSFVLMQIFYNLYGGDGLEAARSLLIPEHLDHFRIGTHHDIPLDWAKHDFYFQNKYPLYEYLIENARGVAVHDWSWARELRTRGYPARYVPFPHAQTPTTRERTVSEPAPDGMYDAVIFGHLGANRALIESLDALAQPQLTRWRLTICGNIWNKEEILEHVSIRQLEDRVNITGYIDDEQLVRQLNNANAAINVRTPTMGETSASQMRIWDHGLPSIVVNEGWYRTVPKDVVLHIDSNDIVLGIATSLLKLEQSPRLADEIGRAGRRWLSSEHCPERYIEALLDLCKASEHVSTPTIHNRHVLKKIGELIEGSRDAELLAQSLSKASWH
jgi:hypothetical protein